MSDQANIQQIYPLTSMQEGMLFHTLNDDSNAYFSQTTYTACGPLDEAVLTRSLAQLAQRHDMLRTSFVYEKVEQPMQVVLKNRAVGLSFQDLTALDATAQQDHLRDFKQRDIARGFDLTRDVLVRLSVLRTAPDTHEFVWSYHHMLMDGWCLATLLSELKDIYQALHAGRPVQLAPAVPFGHYIKWLGRQDQAGASAYWRRYLHGYETLAAIPPDNEPVPGVPFTEPATATLTLGPAQVQQLEAWARQRQTTLNTVFQAVWGVLLARYTGSQDVVFGGVVSGRPTDLPGSEQMIGLFINTMPVRVRFDGSTRVEELVAQLHQDAIEAGPHHHHPLVDIQAGSSLKSALIHHVVAFENYPVEESLLDGPAEDGPFSLHNVAGFEQTNYQLDIDVEIGDNLTVTFYFNPQYYTRPYIERLAGHLGYLFEQVLTQPDAVVAQLEMVPPAERHQLLHEFNAGAVDLGNDQPINLRFEAQAAQWADAPAVLHHAVSWTYAELNAAANRMGGQLRRLGVRPGDFVGIHLERSPALVAGILAILKLGGVYVPLDTQNPVARTGELLASSKLRGLLTDAANLRPLLRQATLADLNLAVLSVDDLDDDLRGRCQQRGLAWADAADLALTSAVNLPNQNRLDSWAYMLYTSGSTGRPKGAITRHDGALNHLLAEFAALELADGFRFLQSASISSDISVWQILAPLLKGGAVVIADKEDLLNYEALLGVLQTQRVSIAEFVPSYLLGLAEYLEGDAAAADRLPALRWMMMVGEEVPVKLVNQWLSLFPACRVLNGYGPCEASDDIAQYAIMAPLPASVRKVPIGRPLANMNIFVVDPQGKLLPVGVAGELVVSGVGVGAGYFREPEKTAASFVPNPFEGTLGDTLYRTGDLARWRPDGLLEFLGRIDSQVKIRGYRVELGEIENRLRSCPAVQDAAVLLKPYQGELLPVAYVVPQSAAALASEEGQAALRQELKDFVQQHLASYMHPACYVLLPSFPLNLSDKVDRKALPEPDAATEATEVVAPANDTETQLLPIWQKVLAREQISTTDNFFDIGGHSLKATRLAAHVNKRFDTGISVRTVFAAPTIQQLARALRAGSAIYQPIPAAPAQASYPISHAQSRLWLVNQLDQEQFSYNMTAAYYLSGPLRPTDMAQALRQLVARHEILRTTFHTEAGEPRQRVGAVGAGHALRYDDWRTRPATDVNAAALAQAQADFSTVFSLAEGPLFRARLIQLADTEFFFVLVLHHIVADGWSADILLSDLFALYEAVGQPTAPALAALPIQYKDFAVWHNQELAGPAAEPHRAYWHQQFAGELPVLELPTDFARPAQRSQRGAVVELTIDAATTARLKQLSARRGGTLFMGLLAAVKALLYRYTGQSDVVVGTVTSGREHSDLENQVGFYVNTLALRTRFSGQGSFEELLDNVKQVALAAFEHQAYPFDQLVDDLQVARELSHSPLFDVLVVLQNNGGDADSLDQLPGLELRAVELPQEYSKFDLTVEAWEEAGTLTLALEYSTDLFTRARIERLGGHLRQLLRAATASPQTAIESLDYLPADEHAELLTLAGTVVPMPAELTIPGLFEQMVAAYPQQVAAADERTTLTYAALNEQANQLAHCLREQHGVGYEDIVGVALTRRVEFVTTVLAVLKAGAAYLPLAANLPAERAAELLADTQAKVLMTDVPALATALADRVACLPPDAAAYRAYPTNNWPVPALHGASLAYVMYTSGSTGKPKGAMIEHRGVLRLVCQDTYARADARQRVLQTGSLAFDAATFEIWGPLLHGGQVHLLALDHLLDARKLQQAIADKGITDAFFTTSWFNQLADENPGAFRGLERVLTGGEKVSAAHVRRVQEHCPHLHIVNLYGPTENTTLATFLTVPVPTPAHISLGRPIANSPVYVVDAGGHLAPKGVPGELWLAGEGVARGYWGHAPSAASPFQDNPFGPGRLYRSGDVGCWREDGQLDFLGRRDEQVKLRGFRVEPAEVAAVLRTHPLVRDAVVLVLPDAAGDKQLVAYYTSAAAGDAAEAAELRRFLQAQLPAYLVPAALLALPALPLT
ncbi:MAG: amino acid adenylation domain-containing protein, partial [Bacteroidota bacterium]|nr:amino acid adenylation domain-containing protein [Bacteroidota bacterium]